MLLKPSSCSGCSLYCQPYGKEWGWVPPSGSGDNGVMIVAEAAGENEELVGTGLIGKAGQFLFGNLKRIGIEREGFRLANVLECRPPDNKLIKMPYTEAAIEHCAPNLDRTIASHVEHCAARSRTPVIVALGKFAFKRLFGYQDWDAIMKEDYYTYPHWNERYGVWVLAAPHPSHVMQGKNNLIPTLQFVFQRALEIAADGLVLETPEYLLDPSPDEFNRWVDGYFAALQNNPEGTFLSYDIETPYKSGKDESEVAREDDDDYIILRCGFSYNKKDGTTVSCSVPWHPVFMADIERSFRSHGFGVNWNGTGYDDVRIRAQMPMNLVSLDAMLAWHVLNTALPKGLGYVTPFYVKNTPMWKHLATPPKSMPPDEARRQEAFYNAKDADMALRCWLEIRNDLKGNELWEVFERHVVQLNTVLGYMSGKGVKLDTDARQAAEDKLTGLLEEIEVKMQAAVPQEARRLKVYKKEPKDVTGLIPTTANLKRTRCPVCGTIDVRASHFKSVGKKRLKTGDTENPCVGHKSDKIEIPSTCWAQPLEFKISKLGLTAYQKVVGHKPFKERKTGKVTFDIKAIKSLIKKYPEDPLYPIIGQYRKVQKLAGTYVGITDERKFIVPDDYVLKEGERFADDN